MAYSVYAPLLLSILLAALSRPLARIISPRTLAPALVIAAGLTAAASTWGLILLAATMLHEAPPVAEQAAGHGLISAEPVPGLVAAAAAAALAVGVYRLVEARRRNRSTHRSLWALCDATSAQELVVISAPEPQAIALPGRRGQRGRVLVTSGMLSVLDDAERSVLLAHERAHLRERHSRQRAIVESAAALNPLLRRTRDTVAFLLERCADEAAADAVGSRPLAARSLAKAALATSAHQRGQALAFHRLAVTTRVAALRVAPPPHRNLPIAVVVLIGVATTVAAADATGAFIGLVQQLLPGRV